MAPSNAAASARRRSLRKTVVARLLDDLLMGLAHVLDGEQPVGQTVLAPVRVGEAHVHELIGRAHHQEIRERELLIARDEDEPIRVRLQEQRVIVREREEAVGVRDQRLDGHETQELVDVEIRGDLLPELLVVAPLDEADELDQAASPPRASARPGAGRALGISPSRRRGSRGRGAPAASGAGPCRYGIDP